MTDRAAIARRTPRANRFTAMSDTLHIHFGGHSSVLLEVDGVKVLTDPLFREWLLHIRATRLRSTWRSSGSPT